MEKIIIYKSQTGFTKQYAQWIGEKLQCDAIDYKDIKKVDLNDYEIIIFGSRIHAGIIDGLKQFRSLIKESNSRLIVFATGATPNQATEEIGKIPENNALDQSIPFFYMQAGLCYEKMGFADKTIMKMLSKMLEKQKNKSSFDEGMKNAISSSYDNSSREYIMPLADYVRGLEG